MEDSGYVAKDWQAIEDDSQFKELVAAKRRFIVPATIFFVLYYFSLPVLVGYFPALMSRNVYGHLNLAYAFALSQFVMAWFVMFCYMRRARYFDYLESQIVAKMRTNNQ